MGSRFYAQSSYPLNILLILEWLSLAMGAIALFLVSGFNHDFANLLPNGLGLIALAGMGLDFPDRWLDKWLYTICEFGVLLLLAFITNFPLPAILFILVVIRNCVLFAEEDLRQRFLITAIFFITCSIAQGLRLWQGHVVVAIALDQVGLVWAGFLIVFGLVILFLQLLVDTVLAQKRSQEQLRKYSLKIEELATVQERNRIARDIHDSLGHSLTIFNIHLEAALRLLYSEPTEAEALLQEAKQIGKQSLKEVRESVMMLRADPIQGKSLQEAIALLIYEFEKNTGITPHHIFEVSINLSDALKITIYRLLQESLTNIYKHAAASQVAIAIQQVSTKIEVSIQDNGRGFDLNDYISGFGLQGMKERTVALTGDLQIKSSPNQGCEIKANFPISIL
jgi:signal transduction histidine kinase